MTSYNDNQISNVYQSKYTHAESFTKKRDIILFFKVAILFK